MYGLYVPYNCLIHLIFSQNECTLCKGNNDIVERQQQKVIFYDISRLNFL